MWTLDRQERNSSICIASPQDRAAFRTKSGARAHAGRRSHQHQITSDSLRSRRSQGAGPLTRLLIVALDCGFATGHLQLWEALSLFFPALGHTPTSLASFRGETAIFKTCH